MNLQKVAYIVSSEGFQIGHNFYAKEFGIFNTATQQVALFHIHVPIPFSNLTDDNQEDIHHMMNSIHGIQYTNSPTDIPQSHMTKLLRWIATKSNIQGSLIAYSGKPHELQALTNAKAKNICNLQDHGLPHFDHLYKHKQYTTIVSTHSRYLSPFTHIICPHISSPFLPFPPCPALTTQYYAAWILHHYGKFSSQTTNKLKYSQDNTNQ